MVLNPMVLQPPRGCWSMSEDTGEVEAEGGRGCYWYLVGGGRKAIWGARNVDRGTGGRAESTRGPVLFHSRLGASCNPGHSWLPLASLPFLGQEKCRGQ